LGRIEKRARLNFSEVMRVSRIVSHHNVLLSTSEKMAIPLAAMMAMARQSVPHVVIAHRLSSAFKTTLFRFWPLQQSFSKIVCVCRSQVDYAVNQLGVPETAVAFVPDKVDNQFFRPYSDSSDDYILAVGQEQRDYPTLFQAVAGTGIKVVVVASSPWSANRLRLEGVDAEEITFLNHIPHVHLRDLYANARLVVTPLFDVTYAAGVNAVLEAMAMAKPLIVSRTAGIADYVVDDVTGQYVPPQDVPALRDTILRLWHAPAARARLGTNARQAVDEGMNLDVYARRIAELVREVGWPQ
jgi:glycosyltransferase involved in cell wall biosynthesis